MSSQFRARLVDHTGEGTLTDGGILWEVVTPDDERVASCVKSEAARELAERLNGALETWACSDPSDRVVA